MRFLAESRRFSVRHRSVSFGFVARYLALLVLPIVLAVLLTLLLLGALLLPCWLLATLLLTTALIVLATTEQLHPALHIHDDLGGIALDPVLLPLAGLQFVFDVHLRALAQVLASDLGQAPEQLDAVPLGALDLLAGLLVGPLLAGGQAQTGDRVAVRQVADVGILTARADQDDFVYSTGRGASLLDVH